MAVADGGGCCQSVPAEPHEAVLAKRLHQIAHPLHAAALTIHAITGTSTDQLAPIRGTDIDDSPRILKTHDSRAHRHCRIHPVPGWARPLLTAAKTHGRLQDRAPDNPLLPLINSHNSKQLRHTATAIHYHLNSP
ncbi:MULTISPECIES: hypothetical protein [unclassified Streptomyces]|uniref:hypothetical protein n=1 Tax=unclassified Streptomyces TaxID=2593676 RepID=UPI002E35C185|nr:MULTISPECIES: hypothetical protein [unclassified Streptomyces]